MSIVKKVLLLFLICTSLFLAAVLILPYTKLNTFFLEKRLPAADTDLKTIEQKYGDFDTKSFIAYVQETLKPDYHPTKKFLTTFQYLSSTSVDHVTYTSYPWEVRKVTMTAEFNRSIKSDRYSKNGIPLDYAVYIKKTVPPDVSLDELLKRVPVYFTVAPGINFTTRNGFEAESGGRVLEVTWEDNEKHVLESRSVWDVEEENTVYLIACRVFKDSPFYNQNTCYFKK